MLIEVDGAGARLDGVAMPLRMAAWWLHMLDEESPSSASEGAGELSEGPILRVVQSPSARATGRGRPDL